MAFKREEGQQINESLSLSSNSETQFSSKDFAHLDRLQSSAFKLLSKRFFKVSTSLNSHINGCIHPT